VGELGSLDYRFSFLRNGKPISPWHDIPLKSGEYFNMITEIPKYEKRKMEIHTKEKFNPIAQDVKKGVPREYHGPIFWNYGCLPQTWEDPRLKHHALGAFGDNDPIDVVEIGSKALPVGSVTKVKVLGAFAMIDDGELDWKVLVVSSEDQLASELNDVGDVEQKCPGVVSGVREWFRWYKSPDGKPLNSFGFGEKCLDKAAAEDIIMETHHLWANLKCGVSDKDDLWIK
jgi:inorganic pyrophosphatase